MTYSIDRADIHNLILLQTFSAIVLSRDLQGMFLLACILDGDCVTLKLVLSYYNVLCPLQQARVPKQIFRLHEGTAWIEKQKSKKKGSLQDDNERMVETLGIMGKGWVKEEIMMALLHIKQIFIEHLLCKVQNYFPRSVSKRLQAPKNGWHAFHTVSVQRQISLNFAFQ